MQKLSPESKSFIILSSLALLGVLICLMLWTDLITYHPKTNSEQSQKNSIENFSVKPADSSGWPTYTNEALGLSFKYNPAWKILQPVKKGSFTVLQVDPGAKFYNIKIYVSPKEYYIMDGLPTVTETIGGAPALNVNNALFGVRANGLYYTFDVGLSMSLLPNFVALVESAKFN